MLSSVQRFGPVCVHVCVMVVWFADPPPREEGGGYNVYKQTNLLGPFNVGHVEGVANEFGGSLQGRREGAR
mgnify:CR=1 FL=1